MSVLACNRNGCTNIMCDRYSKDYGYICDRCFEELVDNGIVNLTPAYLKEFMNSRPSTLRDPKVAYSVYSEIFPLTGN